MKKRLSLLILFNLFFLLNAEIPYYPFFEEGNWLKSVELSVKHSLSRFTSEQVIAYEVQNSQKEFMGYYLLVENSTTNTIYCISYTNKQELYKVLHELQSYYIVSDNMDESFNNKQDIEVIYESEQGILYSYKMLSIDALAFGTRHTEAYKIALNKLYNTFYELYKNRENCFTIQQYEKYQLEVQNTERKKCLENNKTSADNRDYLFDLTTTYFLSDHEIQLENERIEREEEEKEQRRIKEEEENAERRKRDSFYLKYPYSHRFLFGTGFVPLPHFGLDIDLEYSYMYRRLGVGVGMSYNYMSDTIETQSSWSEDYMTTHYLDYHTFIINLPIKIYIIVPNDGFFIDVSAAPGWLFTEGGDYDFNISFNSFCTEFKLELGADLFGGMSFEGFVGYTIYKDKQGFLTIGLGSSLFL